MSPCPGCYNKSDLRDEVIKYSIWRHNLLPQSAVAIIHSYLKYRKLSKNKQIKMESELYDYWKENVKH